MLKRLLWPGFWLLQTIGFLCLCGGDSFDATRAGVICRITALYLLEPGLMVMSVVLERIPGWHSAEERNWFGVVLGILLNAVLFFAMLKLLRVDRNAR